MSHRLLASAPAPYRSPARGHGGSSVVVLLILLDLLSRVSTSSPLLFPNSDGLRKGKEFGEEGKLGGGDG
jgi:hypothetical protein